MALPLEADSKGINPPKKLKMIGNAGVQQRNGVIAERKNPPAAAVLPPSLPLR